MKTIPCLVAGTIVTGLLFSAPATSAFAVEGKASSARTPSAASTRVLTAVLDSYDPVTHEATLSGLGDWHDGQLSVSQKKADGTIVNRQADRSFVDPVTGRWQLTFTDVFAGDTFVAVNGLNNPRVTVTVPRAVLEPEPTISTTVRDGKVEGLLTFARHGLIEIRDAGGATVAGSRLADNWAATPGTPYTYRFVLPDSGHASAYTATVKYASAEHTSVDFTTNSAAAPVAPAQIEDVSATTGERAIVSASGEPGATLTIRDGLRVVGIKSVGKSGRVSIPVAVDDEKVNELTAVQSLAGQSPTFDTARYVSPPEYAQLAAVEDKGFALIASVYVQSPLDAQKIVFRDVDGTKLEAGGAPNSPILQTVRVPPGSPRSITVSSIIDGVESTPVAVPLTGATEDPAEPTVAIEKMTSEIISVRIKATPKLNYVASDPDGVWLDHGTILPYTNPAASASEGTLLEILRSEFTGSRIQVGVFLDGTALESRLVTVEIPAT